MVISVVRRRSSQLPLFVRPQYNPHWTNLSSDVQQQILRLLARLLRQHARRVAEGRMAEEVHGE